MPLYRIRVLCLVSVFLLCPSTWGEHQAENGQREGKFLDRNFWDGFERGLQDTADVFSRMTDNLEVAIGRVADNLEDSFSNLAHKIDKRVDQAMPPFLRQHKYSPSTSAGDFGISAITGEFGDDGVDDGLEVYYPSQSGAKATPEGGDPTQVQISRLPKPERGIIRNRPTSPNGEDLQGGAHGPFGFDIRSSIFGGPGGPPFSPFGSNGGFFNVFRSRPWWQGQNVCIDREEVDEKESNTDDQVEAASEADTSKIRPSEAKVEKTDADASVEGDHSAENLPQVFSFGMSSFEMSSCSDTGEKYTCVTKTNRRGINKTVKLSYRCCHGFVRDGPGCTKVEIEEMAKTLEKLPTTNDFLSLLKAADLVGTITERNLTIFAPTNEAIEEFTADLEDENAIEEKPKVISRNRRETHKMEQVLRGHMVEGFLYVGDIKDEKVLQSLNKDSKLRFNTYNIYPPTVTVNCARIVKGNQHSINGVVHTIDKVITPVEKSIAEIVETDPQFSILKQLLEKADILGTLREEGHMTLFAPTDSAFGALTPSTLKSLMDGSSCLEAVIKEHILPNTICSNAIQERRKTQNLLNQYLVVWRNENNEIFVNDAKMVSRDTVATNGVIHAISKALIPEEAKTVGEILQNHNLTEFIELLKLADMADELNAGKDITVFAPSNRAIMRFPEEDMKNLKNDKEKLREALRYHVTTPSIKARNINNNHMADTVAGHPLRINLYPTVPILSDLFGGRAPTRVTAGCSRVSVLDTRACGAVVHVVEDMLQVPKSDVLETIKSNPNYSLFYRMVKDSDYEKQLQEEGPFTVLAPSDHALKTLPEDELEALMNSTDLKEKIVKKHILREHICCSGINGNSLLFADRKRAVDGSTVHIRRSSSGKLMAGSARITHCGAPTGNGIVHTVSSVLLSDRDFGAHGNERVGNPGIRLFPIRGLVDLFQF